MKKPDKYRRAAIDLLAIIGFELKDGRNLDQILDVVASRLRLSEAEGKVLAADEISVSTKRGGE